MKTKPIISGKVKKSLNINAVRKEKIGVNNKSIKIENFDFIGSDDNRKEVTKEKDAIKNIFKNVGIIVNDSYFI